MPTERERLASEKWFARRDEEILFAKLEMVCEGCGEHLGWIDGNNDRKTYCDWCVRRQSGVDVKG